MQIQPLLFPTQSIQPKILYFGTPVILITSLNEDHTSNLAPMSSAWALGWMVMLGLGTDGKTFENLLYNFRHYFGLGQELGKSFRSET